jgi:hypothetical protein
MKRNCIVIVILFLLIQTSCQDVLEPKPVDILTDEFVLNEAADVRNVEIGLYNAFRNIVPSTVIAGDLTADNLIHNGTFSQYREISVKRITSANASAAFMYQSIYNTIYLANFILEKLPNISGVTSSERERVTATAHFLRGYAFFIGANTFGGIPKVTTTSITNNVNIPRSTKDEIMDYVLEDYTAALDHLPSSTINAGFASKYALSAALARYHLYRENWTLAEQFSDAIIASKVYSLDTAYEAIVVKDYPNESIFEADYTLADDPGTDNNIGLNNLFVSRREIIPSNQMISALSSINAGVPRLDSMDRITSMQFNSKFLSGSDNGWSVAKYGTADQNNNNVMVFRLGEMYLIRAEARAHLNKFTGANSAQTDINILRKRADAPLVNPSSQSEALQLIEEERRYELAFEGHRWYDLVRTGRAAQVMSVFSSNWNSTYELWPIPQREIQNNPALVGNQNPGY